MEEMEISPPSLLNLPTEITEEILQYFALPDRKNLRLTCKQLYELCNSDRFCKDENIIWSSGLNHVNVESDLFRIGRSHYNLVIVNMILTKSSILPSFEKLGAKIRSLVMKNCYCHPGVLESIVMLCEGLCSLSLNLLFKTANIPSNSFTFEPLLITNPHVTNLSLILPPNKAYDFFHRMFSIFPNVKQLKIEPDRECYWTRNREEVTEEFVSIFDDIMKSGGNLECLEIKLEMYPSIVGKLEFFEALPNLKDLTVFIGYYKALGQPEKCYPCCSNLESVKLGMLEVFGPTEMIPLLTNTGLKCLSVDSQSLVFNEECFKKLVASQLHTIEFSPIRAISGLPVTILNSLLEANKTVEYLYLKFSHKCPQSSEMLFPKYFHGLVHLTLGSATDSILQCVFENQENLRSLVLQKCSFCSIDGFCGSSKDGAIGYSINNLQKLEHLTMIRIRPSILNSHKFKCAFNFPRLKYLRIECRIKTIPRRCPRIPTALYENLNELRALRLRDLAVPPHETLSSLFRKLKYLNYLRCDLVHSEKRDTDSMTYINVNCGYFSITPEVLKYEYSVGHGYYDKELDRMVILNAGLEKKFYKPKICACEIDWLDV